MSYFYYKGKTPDNPHYNWLLRVGFDGDDPLVPPPDAVYTARTARTCGSGPYYKSVNRPYLRNGTYTCNGQTYLGVAKDDSTSWAGKTIRLHRRPRGSSIFVDMGVTTYNGDPGRAPIGYYWVSQLTTIPGGICYFALLKISWYGGTAAYRAGPWRTNGSTEEETYDAACQVLSYFNLPNFISDPISYGSISKWAEGPVPNKSMNLSVSCSVSKITQKANWGVHVNWTFDQIPNRVPEWLSLAEAGIIPGRIRNAASLALADAMGSLPEVSANSVANVVELASGLTAFKSLVSSGGTALLRSLASSVGSYIDPRNTWLSWRYVYNTTKMDIEDYRNITNRLINMAGAPTFKVHGVGAGDGFQVRCLKQYRTADFNVLDYDTRRLLRTYGFRLSAYNVWDMIPFSFMADWFLKIGPKLELAEAWNRHYDFTAEDTWYSYRENFQHGFIYYRWHGPDPSIPPTYVSKATSAKTITYRLADTVSIFT